MLCTVEFTQIKKTLRSSKLHCFVRVIYLKVFVRVIYLKVFVCFSFFKAEVWIRVSSNKISSDKCGNFKKSFRKIIVEITFF